MQLSSWNAHDIIKPDIPSTNMRFNTIVACLYTRKQLRIAAMLATRSFCVAISNPTTRRNRKTCSVTSITCRHPRFSAHYLHLSVRITSPFMRGRHHLLHIVFSAMAIVLSRCLTRRRQASPIWSFGLSVGSL